MSKTQKKLKYTVLCLSPSVSSSEHICESQSYRTFLEVMHNRFFMLEIFTT